MNVMTFFVPVQSYMLIIVVSVLQTQASAIRMLQARIETIKEYLVEVQEGSFVDMDLTHEQAKLRLTNE